MNYGTPDFPVLHCLPESAQTYIQLVGDAIQPSHPLTSPSPPAFNLSQPQGLFKWVSSSQQMAKGLEFQLQQQSFGEGNGNPLQCSCLENPRDGGAWWAAVYGVAQSQTRLKQLSSSPSNEYSGLISFRMDWLDLLAAQGTLYSLLQHHSSKASILWHSVFFIVQLFHPYMTTGKTIALTKWTFVGKVMSLLFNMLSRLVITFLQRSKCILVNLTS